jgi:hypothetical protein
MVSLSNHEAVAGPAVRAASWFDKLTMKRLSGAEVRPKEPTG